LYTKSGLRSAAQRLQLDLASLQTLPVIVREVNVLSIFEPNDLFASSFLGVNAFLAESVLLMFHVARQGHCLRQAEEERDGISGENGVEMSGKCSEIGIMVFVESDGAASGSAVVIGKTDAVNIGIGDAGISADNGSNFL
jgi:hypothetical protein